MGQRIDDAERISELERVRQEDARFLSALAHELRTPLGSVLMLSELIVSGTGSMDEDRLRGYVGKIHQSASDLKELVAELSELSKVRGRRLRLEVAAVPLEGVVRQLEKKFQPKAQAAGLELACELAPGLPEEITTDRQRLLQLLGYLLSDTLESSAQEADKGDHAGHEILLRVRPALAFGTAAAVAFDLRDGCQDLPPEHWQKVFEPFQRTASRAGRSRGGASLRLPLARELAMWLGGEVSVTSQGDLGTVFTLCLPVEGGALTLP